jgi:hypothetical protein
MPPFGFFNFFNPPRGRVSGGRVDAGEGLQEVFPGPDPPAGSAEASGAQNADLQLGQDRSHDLVGAAIGATPDVVAPRGGDRPAGEAYTRSTRASSRTPETHYPRLRGVKGL